MKKYFIFVLLIFIVIGCDNRTKEQLADDAENEWLLNENRYKAIELYRKAIDKEDNYDKYDAEMYSEIAYQYWRLENYKEAINNYLLAAKLDKEIENNYEFNENLGASYFQIKDYNNAIKYLEKATKINPQTWYSYSVLASIYRDLGDKEKEKKFSALEKKNYPQSSGSSNYSSSSNTKSEFENWLYANTAVTEVHFESDWQIWVTLESYKYTSEENVEQIAETIARWYAQKMNKSYTVCTVWRGNSIYAKGSYSN